MLLEVILAAFSLGGVVAASYFYLQLRKKPKQVEKVVEKIIEAKPSISVIEAEAKAREIILEAKNEAIKIRTSVEDEARKARSELFDLEKRLANKEDGLEKRQLGIEKREKGISVLEARLKEKEAYLSQTIQLEISKLETIAGLSREEARREILSKLEKELAVESAKKIKETEEFVREESDKKAREILVTALQRIATEHMAATTTSEVKLPDEETKGRVIGKEGRNIKAFETAAGVEVEIIEDAAAVKISSFDPVKREIAKLALERLVADGRIQPARIEEFVEKAKAETEKFIEEQGSELVYKVGVGGLPREIVSLLGRFRFRTSYGQNLIEHTLEVVRIGEALAAELGADVELTKKACLLHDIGKAVTAEMAERGHDEVGAEICRRYGIPEEVVRTFEGHHKEDFPNLEAVLVYLADAISGSRPGARREEWEVFVERVKALENLAQGFAGVKSAYAISAGREVRVVVNPADIDDAMMVKLAHDIAHKIHESFHNFPGPIKVTVLRETRAVNTVR